MSSAGPFLHASGATMLRCSMIASGSKLNAHQDELAAQGVDYDARRAQIKAEKTTIDAELEERWQRVWRAYSKSSKESEKEQRYAQAQCDLLRALEDLTAHERTMYELDNRKDQVMTVCKLAPLPTLPRLEPSWLALVPVPFPVARYVLLLSSLYFNSLCNP